MSCSTLTLSGLRARHTLAFTFAAIVMLPGALASQGVGDARSLRGIGTIMLDVGLFGQQVGLGVDTTAILTRMDVQLRRDRLPVGRPSRSGRLAGNSLLTWKATIVAAESGFATSVSLELSQFVTSPFSKESFFATSWQARGRTSWVPRDQSLRESLLANLDDQLVEFVSAYRSVNP